MTNREKYHFDDFTHDSYSDILSAFINKSKFISYTEIDQNSNYVLLRHDVDFSVHAAYDLAVIENKFGIRSTYFLLLHSEFYNLLDKENIELIKKIINLGHQIGLHFDSSMYEINNDSSFEGFIQFESNIIRKIFNTEVNAFSFHNPSVIDLKRENFKYAGLINTYATIFKQEIAYCSDSNGYWRHSRLSDFVVSNLNPKVQILTHPEWWRKIIMSPAEKVEFCIKGRTDYTREFYKNLLEQNNRTNIDW